MPNHPFANGLSGHLQSSESWGQQQALALLRQIMAQSMSPLTSAQRLEYLRLQRAAHDAFKAVDAENTRLIKDFKDIGVAQLRNKLGGLDPHAITLHTRYLEKLEPPQPWEPRKSTLGGLAQGARFRRDVDEWKYRTHVSSLSLWDAACLNFDFATGTPQASGHRYVDASYLTGVSEKRLSVSQFIAISRELDLGGQLQARLSSALGPGGKLHGLIETSARTHLQFEALEAYRDRATTGLTQPLYDKLVAAIDGSGTALPFETLSMDLDKTILPAVPFALSGTSIPLPLLLIKVGSLGVVSYFPFRPGGALRYHTDAKVAGAAFLDDIKASHRDGDLGWFARQLPVTEINLFTELLRDEPRPEGLSPVAGFLYDSFHSVFPEQTLDHLRFVNDPRPSRPSNLVQALTYRHIQHYQSNLATLATQRSARDLQAVIDGAAAIASELMELLITPVPGGVSGLNRVMQVVVFGNLTYSLIIGVNEAAKGQASDFAAAMADVADLAVNGLLISTAGRVHRQRIEGLMQRMGGPRKVTHSDGTQALWKPDITPYAVADQRLLDGQTANAQGLYLINGHHYVRVQQGDQQRVAEVAAAPETQGFVLKRRNGNGNGFAAPITFDPKRQAWVLDLHGAGQLSDYQLIEQMLPNGEAAVPPAHLRNLLRSTAVSRATLDAIWAGEPPPVNLIEAVRRVQIDRVIEQLSSGFHHRGNLPAHAGSALFALLTQLPTWPADAVIHVRDQHGHLVESHAANETATLAINLRRRDDGTYLALDAPDTDVATQESLFESIIRQQPATSTLGKEGSPNLTEAQRIARLRVQIGALAGQKRTALFTAMTHYASHARHQVPAGDSARSFVPIKNASTGVEVTALLSKLQAQFAPLSPPNLKQLLVKTPLSATQQSTYLKDGKLPGNVREHLEQHRTALRIDAVIDGLYHPRTFNSDTDLWAREFAASLLLERCKRPLVITEMAGGPPKDRYKNTGPEDTTVELLHYGDGRYEAYDMRNAGPIPVSPAVDSFYLAIGSVLQPHERSLLGMSSATDAQGLRNTLGDLMSERRSPAGLVSLLDYSLAQYEKKLVLPTDLQPNPEGLYDHNGEQLMPLYGSFYPVTFDQQRRVWRLKHPQKVGVDTPRLKHNRHGAWRLESENPLTWDDYHLVSRLGTEDFSVDQPTAARLLKVTDTPPRALREVHCAGLPPPPLLKDSSKRFGIERKILHFIKAMTTYSATRNAKPSLQLLLVCALPQWPASHVLELHDEAGRTIAHYPAANAGAPHKIRLSDTHSRSQEPLAHLVRNDDLSRALLGELPQSQEERLFKLAKKIAEHAYRERSQLFDTLYAQGERNGNRLHTRMRAHYPQLPASAIQALIDHATPHEIKQLSETDGVPLRLQEQARLTANDMRLNRAFEGLYLSTVANPDSEKIILHVLKLLPGWPIDVRLDIHQGSATGPLLESAGYLAGSERKKLARVDARYQAYDAEGQLISDPVNTATDLLTAVWRVLNDTQRKALGLDDSGELSPLRNAIAELALSQRIAIKGLLGLPHIPYWLQPPMPVNSTFTAYPFSMRNWWPLSLLFSVDMVSKVREVYPRMSRDDALDLTRNMRLSEPQVLQELERRKMEYQALELELNRWAAADYPGDHELLGWMNPNLRIAMIPQILKAWRQESLDYHPGLLHAHSLELRLDGNQLPNIDFMPAIKGFEHIEYLKIAGTAFPPTGNAFLRQFPNLKKLHLDCGLTQLPSSITQMTQLEILDLNNNNNIVLDTQSRQQLAGMTHLARLNLSHNPLNLSPDVSAMTRLHSLDLHRTGISQWPIGAERLPQLRDLRLQENNIATIPDVLFTDPQMRPANQGTFLHDNPLNADAQQRLAEYRDRTNQALGGAMPGIHHVPPASNPVDKWLVGVPAAEHAQRKTLWEQLENDNAPGSARPDDTFRVLRDLTEADDYVNKLHRRPALIARVWRLLQAMAESYELRQSIFLNTYVSGTCGDGALLTFIDMELRHKQHQAMALPSSNQANRELLALAQGLFYLRNLDQFAEDHLQALHRNHRPPAPEPDDVEVKLFFRLELAEEFNLPILKESRRYSPGDHVLPEDLERARKTLRDVGKTSALEDALLTEEFWVQYLVRHVPEPFTTIEETARYKLEALKQEVPDTRSMDYQERRQSIKEVKETELNRLISQLTRAAQSGAQRAD